jgi:hypothetical protein
MASNEQELLPEQTQGFKVGEKRTIDEYHKMGTFNIVLPHGDNLSISTSSSRRCLDTFDTI